MTGLLAFDADQHEGSIAALAVSKGVQIFLPYYKLFSTTDRDEMFAAGKAAGVQVGIIPISETTAEDGLGGAEAGTAAGQRVVQYMKAVGQPPGTAWILTFDFDEQASQDPETHAYAGAAVAAVNAGMGADCPMIAYANGALAEDLKSAGTAKFAWDAGGMGMRGTRVDVTAGHEDMVQDVGDKRNLNLGISIDSDFAPNISSPAELDAWMDSSSGVAAPPQDVPKAPVPQAIPQVSLSFPKDAKALQRQVGANPDGDIGDLTRAAIAQYVLNAVSLGSS